MMLSPISVCIPQRSLSCNVIFLGPHVSDFHHMCLFSATFDTTDFGDLPPTLGLCHLLYALSSTHILGLWSLFVCASMVVPVGTMQQGEWQT